ncbi:phenylalanine--tRNA ligase subunit alpha [Fulvivirgaceae bacterium BMA12]|uniref:Phenylalanine--tRNA ligase alpha subunit n=1 Tax=Agaribacillus aureus TaxID=3051825 RepID=A0ABT8LG66_9BACT|nr:phenylalanine--tRNA ligase subunit alpha [Fulvivirgaceae bacterium BMA12]
MLEKVQELKEQITRFEAKTQEDLEAFRMRFISRKSVIGDLFAGLKDVAATERKHMGIALNDLKNSAQQKFQALISEVNAVSSTNEKTDLDLTLPPATTHTGSLHPLTIVRKRIIEIFERIGFNVADGPEMEDDWHNFTALNFPENHPARDMQDTFFIEKNPDMVLRTHTSNVQIRLMEVNKPPIRSIMPGRVFRNEAISARAHCIFHQVEGLYINKNVGFKDLKQTLFHFAQEMFGKDTRIRFRPSYFPFTEPSAEMDISCFICKGKGCKVCKGTGWVEILGCGMVDPNVLDNCGIDSEVYTGYAFGMGIERIAMLKYDIDDLRLFFENDIRFLKQFSAYSV